VIAIDNNVVMGFIFGNIKYLYNTENCGFILELYTSKNFRSKGIASKLVNNFAEMCLNKRIYLTSAPNSILFYEKVGFIDTGLVDEDNNLKIFVKN
jgi:ribosomal protein S18 acetylase RimI-like enzyme